MEDLNQKSKKVYCFTNNGKLLLIHLLNILHLHLKLNTKQDMEKISKYSQMLRRSLIPLPLVKAGNTF